jgi:tetratricopeptide (TPR) repeat protein
MILDPFPGTRRGAATVARKPFPQQHSRLRSKACKECYMQRNFIVLSACVLISALPVAWAAGGGPMPRMNTPQPTPSEDQAKSAYNDGVRDVHKADKYQTSADEQSDAKKKDKAQREAKEHYTAALNKFMQAVRLDPRMHEAWNYVGYTNRKLGEYQTALAAYERALVLHPGYPEALEYRGEAFLALHRISDAEQAYLDLFAANRQLADKLLTAMKGWVTTQRTANSGGSDATAVDAFDKWVQERAQIASQTASLTRAGAASTWR